MVRNFLNFDWTYNITLKWTTQIKKLSLNGTQCIQIVFELIYFYLIKLYNKITKIYPVVLGTVCSQIPVGTKFSTGNFYGRFTLKWTVLGHSGRSEDVKLNGPQKRKLTVPKDLKCTVCDSWRHWNPKVDVPEAANWTVFGLESGRS